MPPLVETTSGPVCGVDGPDGVVAHLGIPYAAPPTGELRFAAPSPPPPWTAPLDATRFGPGAPQSDENPMGDLVPGMQVSDTDEGSCLTLNVWTPGLDDHARPVMVWLHGGAFSLGSSSLPVYDGARLARRGDVVVVSCNYRLGALGFLVVDGPGCTTNCGLRDQIAALQWVHHNIARFGGDPANVTIFGESAGAGSVLSLLASPAARPWFTRAICQSGATDLLLDLDRAAEVTATVARHAGVASDAASLRSLDADTLVRAQTAAALELAATVGTMPFHPVVDGDLLPLTWPDALGAGHAATHPLLIGTTVDEMRLFVDMLPGGPVASDAELVGRLGYIGAPDPAALAGAYERAQPSPATADDRWWRALTDQSMWVPAMRLADAHAAHQPSTFVYRFDWQAADPRKRACHGLDIPFPFDTLDHDGWWDFVADPDDARTLAHTIQDAWVAFARTGVPSCDPVGDWPAHDAERRPTVILDQNVRVEHDPHGEVLRLWRTS
ncbi:MAG: carboxylesterase/lipase family protein [Acidimicrobiales bacterium]|nr:carboxylesterase/lipase family protein [Acidimicrobiales bacterium]